jgi:hypothetical protein
VFMRPPLGLPHGQSSLQRGTGVFLRERMILGSAVWRKVDNNCSFVRLENEVQHSRDLLGRRLGLSDSDECRGKGGSNAW